MKKRYIASTVLSVNVMIGGQYKRHICFNAAACSGSYYVTSDEEEQEALEKHSMFGKVFKLAGIVEEPEQPECDCGCKQEKAVVNVSSLTEAKDYLVEKFEISRTKLRTKEAIVKMAEQYGVEFVGI